MTRNQRILNQVQKIAVLRANGLGDLIVALPALQALRDTYPEAEISLLTTPWVTSFTANRNFPADRVIVVPPSKGVRVDLPFANYQEELEHFFVEMQHEQFDIAIQLHGGGMNSNPFVSKLGATTTVGMRTPSAPFLDRWIPYQFFHHEVLRYLEVMKLVGADPSDLEPKIEITDQDKAEANRFLHSINYQGQSLLLLHPGASEVRRRWPAARFGELAHLVATHLQVTVIVTGTGSESREVNQVVDEAQRLGTQVFSAGDQLSVGGLAGLCQQAKLMISNDTGPAHVARAVGTPTVTLFWGPNLYNWGPLNPMYNRVVVSWQLECSICGHRFTNIDTESEVAQFCEHRELLLVSIKTDQVWNEVHTLWRFLTR